MGDLVIPLKSAARTPPPLCVSIGFSVWRTSPSNTPHSSKAARDPWSAVPPLLLGLLFRKGVALPSSSHS